MFKNTRRRFWARKIRNKSLLLPPQDFDKIDCSLNCKLYEVFGYSKVGITSGLIYTLNEVLYAVETFLDVYLQN